MRLNLSMCAALAAIAGMITAGITSPIPETETALACKVAVFRGSGGNCSGSKERPGDNRRPDPGNDGGGGGGNGDRGDGGNNGGGGGGGGQECHRDGSGGVPACLDQPGNPGNPGEPAPPPVPTVTEHDFQSFAIPPSVPHSWPSDWGVAKRRTAFWADAGTKYINVTLLGQAVTVKATPVKYQWDFGDGTRKNSHSPGHRPASLSTAKLFHSYRQPGRVSVRVITTYTGQFRVGSGGWQDIAGTAAVGSSALPLTIYRYHKYLVEDDCAKNPDGPDCRPSRRH